MKRATLFLLLILSTTPAFGQLYSADFDNVPAGTVAETINVPGLTFLSSPQGVWQTVAASSLGFASLSGNALYEPRTPSQLQIQFSGAVTSVSFSFAMSALPGASSIIVNARSGGTTVATITQVTTSAGATFGEGSVNLTSATPFDRILILSADATNLIAIDNLRVFGAALAVTRTPQGMVQTANTAGATDSFVVTNVGGVGANVTLSKSGAFFSLSPASFALAPGAAQVVAISGTAQPAGFYQDNVAISASGVGTAATVAVRLLSSAATNGSANVVPAATRVDVSASGSQNPSGSVAFRNNGSSSIVGLLVSDVPWIIPQSGAFTLAAGETRNATFTIDRSKRPDAASPIGSVTGSITLVLPTSGAGKVSLDAPTVNLGTRVSIVDTSKPQVSSSTLPPLQPNELALFVPGVGHVVGSVGTFISDVNVANAVDLFSITGVDLFYVPSGATTDVASVTIPRILPSQAVNLADVVKSIYGRDAQVGSMQIRGAAVDRLSVSANIFNASNPAGTFGTAIPVFRSDRAARVNEKIYLAGLLKDSTHHTNLFIQETSGVAVTVHTEFLGDTGGVLGVRDDVVPPFNLFQINNPLPDGAKSAILTNIGGGRFHAYATPVDRASGDNWVVVDWNRQNNFSGASPVIVPVAGAVHGANSTYFRTDISLMNTGNSFSGGTLRYVTSSGQVHERIMGMKGRESYNVPDVVKNIFELTTDTVGYLTFTPSSPTSSWVMTSHTYTTVEGSAATFGTAVPSLALSASLRKGSMKIISGLSDASNATIAARVPATFRSNIGLVETTGAPVTVRITLLGADGRSVAFGALATRTVTLTPYQYLPLNQIGAAILGDLRSNYGDLFSAALRFDVIDGAGAVAVYTSSIDNGTGDSILRSE